MRSAPRCGAKTRAGGLCQCPAIHGRLRCRIHGGLSPGAPRGAANGNFKDGYWTVEAAKERRWVRKVLERYAKGTDQ
ncbi:HGGxSTG domain-containing protein [Bradyrhizobium sp. CB1650]|uniref:HGGxSTG domain-containing protein n=1 Tax=Bradyrhizobium sp. CB1650 TaxID=3039153 RepID=UPI002434D73C|nr:HGGxSTG domain-containing protein [Bradyrhizobium sp. CB1650]WGD56588.1 HGGxSTG domain-containing protein [Bradyrhizobium sp. CB1650]